MNRCSHPDHPHCTAWVMPGEAACAHGHAQPGPDMLSRLGTGRSAADAILPVPADPMRAVRPDARPHLHVSGFDPRAAGGRQTIKLELRGMPDDLALDAVGGLTVLMQSALLPGGGTRQQFTRSLHGEWRPLFVEFSSRGREHGQYRIDLELHARGDGGAHAARTWVCTLVLLVPRPDASLGEIHQTFLSTHKNVRISADDASIARLQGLAGGGALDIDIQARNASIAQLDLARVLPSGGRIDLSLPTIAWDEDLIEIDQPASRPRAARHPCPSSAACLVHEDADAARPRHLRLFALDECVLGRFEAGGLDADLLLQHYGEQGAEPDGLTRRLSARHAVIRPARQGFEIEDVSRYGVLLDGAWPGKHVPVLLRLGMRIELTASIRGVCVLVVTGLLPHGVVLHRVDAGGADEAFMLLTPESRPALPLAGHSLPRADALPLVFHRDGGFWHLDAASGQETPLSPATLLERLPGVEGRVRFAGGPRPEDWVERKRASTRVDRRRAAPPA